MIQVPANTAGDGPSEWVLATLVGDQDGGPGSWLDLAQPWLLWASGE